MSHWFLVKIRYLISLSVIVENNSTRSTFKLFIRFFKTYSRSLFFVVFQYFSYAIDYIYLIFSSNNATHWNNDFFNINVFQTKAIKTITFGDRYLEMLGNKIESVFVIFLNLTNRIHVEWSNETKEGPEKMIKSSLHISSMVIF